MTELFDKRHVRRAFSRSAQGYDAAAALQHAVEANLLESLDYLDDPKLSLPPPQCVLDLGAGPGRATAAMRRKWPKARVVAVDLALPMLREAGKRSGWWRRSIACAPTCAPCPSPKAASTWCSPTCACSGSKTCLRCSRDSAACSSRAG
jgi:malonyl-CoA O-methyltransferase